MHPLSTVGVLLAACAAVSSAATVTPLVTGLTWMENLLVVNVRLSWRGTAAVAWGTGTEAPRWHEKHKPSRTTLGHCSLCHPCSLLAPAQPRTLPLVFTLSLCVGPFVVCMVSLRACGHSFVRCVWLSFVVCVVPGLPVCHGAEQGHRAPHRGRWSRLIQLSGMWMCVCVCVRVCACVCARARVCGCALSLL
jgi:hypothetical protein